MARTERWLGNSGHSLLMQRPHVQSQQPHRGSQPSITHAIVHPITSSDPFGIKNAHDTQTHIYTKHSCIKNMNTSNKL